MPETTVEKDGHLQARKVIVRLTRKVLRVRDDFAAREERTEHFSND
jgi:hypothetical protein